MESAASVESNVTPLGLQRLWGRRMNGSIMPDELDLSELLSNNDAFPSAQFTQVIYFINFIPKNVIVVNY